ncbi:hypothetical protein [Mesonia aquimarina]|uniref:hypothetical protein n=1 Tax=Mesonia aquimarina TaxID=1504967 RepID=UPI000EF5D3A6|nr:hypothetical protein [Mesonia aquimarina]
MDYRNFLYIFFFLFGFFSIAQNFPGGVTGAEVWFVVDHNMMANDQFLNYSQSNIIKELNNCGNIDKDYINFNEAIATDKLCLSYIASLENSIARNVFFVGVPKN